MKLAFFSILLFIGTLQTCMNKQDIEDERVPLVEVEGQFLYAEDINTAIPGDVNTADSLEMAQNIIRKWATDVLIFENAKRNTPNEAEIEKMVQEYRKSLIIHQYQQNLIEQRLRTEPTEEQIEEFYKQYGAQMQARETVVKGFLLVLPKKSQKLKDMRLWVTQGDTTALKNIEKHHLQNAISYDYFVDNWTPLSVVQKKLPEQIKDPSSFVTQRFHELTDSVNHHYLLHISGYVLAGKPEPYELAKEKITNIIRTRIKAEYISKFETDLYNDAIKNGYIKFFEKEQEESSTEEIPSQN